MGKNRQTIGLCWQERQSKSSDDLPCIFLYAIIETSDNKQAFERTQDGTNLGGFAHI